MSKMNNNSHKNSKFSKKTTKKVTRSRLSSKKNFKIENLEPRLMMDASAGFDVDKINAYTTQFEAIATIVSEKASAAIESFNEFDVKNIGIPSTEIKKPIFLFAESSAEFKDPIANEIKSAFSDVLNFAKTKVEEQVTNLSLPQFVAYANEFIQSEAGKKYENISFAVDGENEDKLIVNVKLSNTTDVSGLEFSLGDVAKINANGSRNLSSTLEFQVAIDLDKNSDGKYLDDGDDFSVDDAVIKKLDAAINDFGGNADFMGLTIQEQTDSEETGVDLSLSYDASLENSKVTSAADLEFALAGSETLPFEFAEGQIMKVSIVDGKFVAKVPTIQMKEGFLLAPKVSALISEDSFVNDLTLKFGDENVSIENSVSIFNELMGKAMIALKGAIKNKNIDAATLLECLRIVAGDNWFKQLAVSGIDGTNLIEESIGLNPGSNKVILTFTQSDALLNGLNVYSLAQNNLKAQLSLGIELTIDIDAEGNVSFTGANVCQFNLDAYGIEIPNDQGYPISGEKNELNVSLEEENLVGSIKLGENFTMNSVFRGFSAADLPVFERLRIPVGSKEFTVADVASKMDVLWNFIPEAVSANLTGNSLDMSGFASTLNSALAVDYAGLETVFNSVERFGSESTLNLVDGDNNLALKIVLNSGILKKLDLDLFDLNDVKMDTNFIVNVVLSKKNGVVSFANVLLQKLDMVVNGQSVEKALFDGVDAELEGGKFDLNISVVNEKNRLKVEKCLAELGYSAITFKSGSSNLLHAGAGNFSYSYFNSEWNLPSDVVGVITHLEENSFSVANVIENAEKAPFFEETLVSNIASKVDEFRNVISFALLGQIQETGESMGISYCIDISALKSKINDSVDSSLKAKFKSVKIEFEKSGVEEFDIFDDEDPEEYSIVGLLNGPNSIKVTFELSQEILNNLRVYSTVFAAVTLDTDVCVKFDVNVGDGEGKYISDYSLKTFRLTVKDPNPTAGTSITIDSTDGLVVSYDGSWSESGVIFNAPKISFDSAEDKLAEKSYSDLKFDESYRKAIDAVEFLEPVSDFWNTYVFKALMSTVKWSDGKKCVVDTGSLKTSLEKILSNNKVSASTWFSSVKIVKANSKLFGSESNGFDICGGTSDSDAKLTDNVYFIVFTFNTAKLNELNLFSQSLKNLDVDVSVALKITLSAGEKALGCESTLESVLYDVNLKNVIPETYGSENENETNVGLTGNVQILWDSKDWRIEKPDFVLDGGVSLKNELSKLGNVEIAALHDKKLNIGSKECDISDVAEQAEECWNCLMEVLYSKLAEQKQLITTDAGIKEITAAYKTALAARINDTSKRLFNDDIVVTNNGGKYTATFALKTSSIKALEIGGVNVGDVSNVTCKLTLSVDTSIEKNAVVDTGIKKDVVVFSKATLDGFYLELTKKFTETRSIEVVKDKYNAELSDATFKLSVELTGTDFTPVTTCNLSCTSYDLKKNDSTSVYLFANAGTFAFVDGSWQHPSDLKKYLAIADSDQYSLKKQINLADNYQLPYVGDSLKIGGSSCRVTEIIEKADEIRTKILLAIQNELNQNKSEIDLSKVYNELGNASSFLSSLKLNNVELLNASLTGTQTIQNVLILEITPKIDNCTVTLGSTNVTTDINVEIVIDIEINKNEKSLQSKLKTFTFDLPGITSANTDELTYKVEKDALNISLKNGVFQSNLKLDEFVDDFYLSLENNLDILDSLDIPLLKDVSFTIGNGKFSVKEVIDVVNNYNRFVQYVTDESIEVDDSVPGGNINLANIKSIIKQNVSKDIPLDNVAIFDKSLERINETYDKTKFVNLLNNEGSLNNLALNDGENVLVFKLSPGSLKLAQNLNLGLINVDGFNVGFDAYIKVVFYVFEGWVIYEDCFLDCIDLNLSVGVNKINLGLFDVELPDGQLSFKVGINPNADLEHVENLITEKSINLEYSDVIVAGYKLPSLGSGNTKEFLSYNFDTGEWTLPESIRKFASFSSDNLITKVHTVLDTTQSALRNLVESKTKLDFLDGSIEKVVDVVDKVEKVVYGDGESGKRANELYGLCKEVNGQYQANFGDVQGFVDKFNESWCYFVLEKNPATYNKLNEICSARYFYKEDGKDEQPHKGDATKDKGISSVELAFNLGFELGHDFGLNFAKSLGEQLANISTCGSIHVGADAKMKFTLKIDFESQKNLKEDSTLSDIGLLEHEVYDANEKKNVIVDVTKQEHYITYEPATSRTFDDDLTIKIVKSNVDENIKSDDEKNKLAEITINKGVALGETTPKSWNGLTQAPGANADVKINYVSSSRQIYITANQRFDITNAANDVKPSSSSDAPSGGDAFSELKLTGSNLQTMFDSKISDKTWTLYCTEDKNDIYDNGALKSDVKVSQRIEIDYEAIEALVNEGFIHEKNDKKKQVNEYLSLQVDDENGNTSLYNGVSTRIIPLSEGIEIGRSIMNTYGLYVVDVDEANDKVIFGCDSRLIQSGDEKRYLLCNVKKTDADKVDYVTYMRVSGEINPSMNTAGMKGALVYETEKTTDSNVVNIYYVSFDRSIKYNDEGIKSLNNSLDSSLKDKIEFKKVNDEDESIVNIVSKDESLNQYIVKYTDSILKMKIGTSEVFVDVEKCLTVENLAETIYKTFLSYKNPPISVSSVTVVDGKIVFTAVGSSSIKIYNGAVEKSLDSKYHDFWINDENKPIDFQECIIDASKGVSDLKDVKISALLTEINNKIKSSGFEIILGSDPSKQEGDHFEIIGSDKDAPFTLNSIGTSKVLEWLGFTSGQESKLINGEMRIVGSSVISFDWAKATSFEKIELTANLSLKMGHSIALKKVSNSKDDRITLYIDNDNDTNDFKVDGFIDVDHKYYRILKVNVDGGKISSIVVSLKPINGDDTLADALKLATWKKATYVASATASVGFLGVDIIAGGEANLESKFVLKKSDDKVSDSNDLKLFGFKVDKTESKLDPSGEFEIASYADIFGESVYLAGGEVKVETDDKNDHFKVSGGLDINSAACQEILNQFKNFSIEKLFAVLETLLKRLDDITKNSDVKIPVINKSISDLVNVANDLRDIIARLRADKVTTIQKFGDLLNTYLEEFHLTSHTPNEKLFKLEPVFEKGTKNIQALNFTFDIQKDFATRHRFSFGSGSSGVHGNIDLDVTGDFWFTLSAELDFSELDLKINNDGLTFGADIGIAGDKLRFDLGINAGDGKENLLSNLISVGSDKNDAFIYGKVGFAGSYGDSNEKISLSEFNKGSLKYSLPVAIFGKLPVYACNMSLGNVYIGKCVNENVAFKNCNNYEAAKKAIEAEMKAFLDVHNEKKSDKLYILADSDLSDSFGIDIKTGTEDDDEKKELNDKFIVDFSDAYQKISDLADFANMDWFSKIKLAVAGLNNLFEMLESSMNSNMGSKLKSVPVVGSALSTGVDFLSVLRDKVLDPFSKFVYESTGLTAEMVAKKMNSLLKDYLLNVKYDKNDNYYFNWGEMDKPWTQSGDDGKGTWYRSDNKSAEWFFNLGGTYDYGKSINFDLGFPGLGLKSNAGLDLSLTWALEFGFGISQEKGFYFIFGDGNEIDVKASASLNGDIEGALAGLGLKLDVDPENSHHAKIELGFGVDLNDPKTPEYGALSGIDSSLKADEDKDLSADDIKDRVDKKLLSNKKYGLVELSSAFAKPEFDFSANVDIVAGITVGVTKDLDRNTPKFPNINGRFDFNWDSAAGVKKLGFYDIKLDMGSFIGGVLGPIISKIQKVIEPLEPLIDFLTTPFPVLKDLGIKITPLDLAKKYSNGKFDDSMVYAIKDLIAISKTISAVKGSGLSISIGNFELINGSGSGADSNAVDFVNGKSSVSAFIGKGEDFDKNVTKYTNGYNKDTVEKDANAAMKKQGLNMDENGGWEFVWNKPSEIFKLLLGEDIDLVKYTMPTLSFDFDWSTFVRIWGPLGARIGVNFNASIQLSFGYDTLGIRQWVKSDYKDFGRLVNGFYVGDLDRNGVDVNELSFYGGLNASAELNAGISAGVGGGVGINVGFNLYDPNKDGKVRLSEMTQIIKRDGLFGMFDVNGKITAKLYAYVKLLFYKKKWNITGDITLFEFSYEHKTAPVMASKNDNGDVVGHVGPNAGDRISTDKNNPSLNDGDEIISLTIDGRKVSWDGDSTTVDEDKKLIIDGGAGVDKITVKGNAKCDVEILGGDGDDVIDLSGLTVEDGYAVIIKGGSGNDKIFGAHGLNIIFGDTGIARIEDDEKTNSRKFVVDAEVVADGAGDDVIIGNSDNGKDSDNNTIITRNFIAGGAGNDRIYGGIGNDIIFGDGGKVEFDVAGVDDNAKKDIYKERATLEEYKSIAKAVVTDNDKVKISRTDISADGGNDVILGGAGDDYIYGGAGNDHVDGGSDKDHIYGERGHDVILGGSGDDYIYGGSGHDVIFGDKLNGDSVNIGDLFKTKFFSDEFKDAQFSNKESFNGSTVISRDKFFDVYGNDKDQKITITKDDSSTGVDYIYGEEGDDLIFGDNGVEQPNGTDNGQGDTIEGGIGNDIIDGNGGNDTISGGIDNDIIYGGSGNDTIDGGAGNDSLYGDNGIRNYIVDDEDAFEGKQITFGENLGLSNEPTNKIYKKAVSGGEIKGGNDKIMTGPGMDFVDGQGGSDQIIVNLMGESEMNYANITDSGTDKFDTDTLTIEGTEYNDRLLMRMNKEETQEDGETVNGTLGFVALLPEKSLTPEDVVNENIERVNFTRGIDVVNLNGNGGDDRITIDGTAKITNVDGGAGNDSFQIGQLYNSDRVSGGNQGIVKDDEFHTVQEIKDDKYLSDGVTKGTTLNVEGGVGSDDFTLLHNVGTLSMAGGRGNDAFSIYNYRESIANPDWTEGSTEEPFIDQPVESGAMSIDGGAGCDTLNVVGSVGDDTVIITKNGMLSDSVGVKVAGVETTNFDAGAGDDFFHVLGNKKGETTNINGGFGNDTVSVGGLDKGKELCSSETNGQTNSITYEILSKESDDLKTLSDEDRDSISDLVVNQRGVVRSDDFVVMDTSSQPVVFYSLNKDYIDLSNVTVAENGACDFYVGYAGDIKNGTINVVLNVPMLSSTALQHGDRGIVISKYVTKKEGDKDVEVLDGYSDTVTLSFGGSKKIEKISVKALSDNLLEELSSYSIAAKCDWTYAGKTENLDRSVKVISVNVQDDGAQSGDAEYKNLLTHSDEFRVSSNSIYLGEFAKDFSGEVSVYVKNKDVKLDDPKSCIDLSTGILTLPSLEGFDKETLVVNYRADKMRIDGSKLRLVYDNLKESAISVKCYGEDDKEIPVCSKSELANHSDAEIYYSLLGDGLVFYNRSNNRLASMHGYVSVSCNSSDAEKRIKDDDGVGTQDSKPANNLLIIDESKTPIHRVLTEALKNEKNTTLNSTTFSVTYNGGEIADGEAVYVKVYATEFKTAGNDHESHLKISCDGKEGSFVIIKFTHDEKTKNVTVSALHDEIEEEYGKIFVDTKPNVINDVEGNVYAYGEGTSIVADLGNADVLKYNHKLKNKDGVVNASKFNEKNTYDVSLMGVVLTIEVDDDADETTILFNGEHAEKLQKGGTVKIIKGDLETEWLYVKEVGKDGKSFKVDGKVLSFGGKNLSNVYALFSDAKDYLFASEADNTDRIFVNNQGAEENATTKFEKVLNDQGEEVLDSVRFTNKVEDKDKQWQGELIANNFEFGEYNLGSGEDTVDISKTHYREDGFQTFTVVNTGMGDDTVNVNSYKNEADGQLIINAEEGNDHVYAPNPELNLGEDAINKDGMVVIGGDGEDVIKVGRGVIAFGDKGNIQYKNAKGETVTNLGYEEVDENNVKTGKLIRTKISKDPKTKEFQKQTDGIVRGATSIKSVMDSEGAHDEITAGGTNSIIIGGADEDTISVGGDNNVVLGDNGEVVYITNESLTAKWNDSEKPSVKLKHVKTTSDDVGAKDTITISGNSNVAMGGAANDTITIGSEDEKDPDATEPVESEENSTGNANVVLGDGGVYEFDKQSNTVTVHTSREEENGKVTIYGDKDEIKIYGGHNTVMGGAAGDDIDIYGADNIVLGDGGIAVRDDKKDVAESIKSVQTTDDSEGGVDNINVWGGDNTVMGGADGDNINIGGNLEKEGEEEKSIVLSNNNVVLGDGGKYERQSADSKTIETTHDSIGGVDTINIYGGYNTVMGGAVGDTINIGIAGQPNSGANNIILGDGGKYVENSTEKTVQTTSDATGGVDTIHVYGGSNVAMGGAKNDEIYIGEAGYNSDNNVVLGDGGIYDLKKDVSLDISTTSDEIGGRDTIEIHGGKNAVMGGFKNDDIDIFGNDNVVLGDGGTANYDKHPEVVKDNINVNAGLIKVETSADEIEVKYADINDPKDEGKRLNDEIDIHGDINIVMGGVDADTIVIDGSDNVVVGDAGVYTVRENSLTVETKSEPFGGQDYIQTGDGQNTILGGTDVDTILTGRGNDIIVGDGGLVIMDKPEGDYRGHNPLIVTNSGKNINEKNEDEKSAGGDFIHAGDGNNVIFGGLGNDQIDSGKGEDVVFGDNGYATFRGNAGLSKDLHDKFTDLQGVFSFENAPEIHDTATLSFNFQGSAQQGINADETAGAPGFQSKQWNNISGSLAGTYGNDDKEIVRFDNGDRASSVSVSYAGHEDHRNTSTDGRINAQNYNHWFWNNSADSRLMTSGIMTTSHNDQKQNIMEVAVDGLKQHFDSYQVAVYMDIPDAHSWENQSVRLVSLYIDGIRVQAFYINDPAGANFTGEFKNRSVKAVLDGNGDVVGVEVLDEDGQTVIKPMDDAMGRELAWSNYVVFDVGAEIASDRIVIVIEDGIKEWHMNGKDLPGIAGIQVKGQLHKQDIAASTDVKFGGDDEIMTRGGDDIVVGGTGSDTIVTYGGDYYINDGEVKDTGAGIIIQNTVADQYVRAHTTFDDERLGIYDNDVVFGDNAKMLFTERDGDLNTASTLTTAESVTISEDEISHSEIDKTTSKEKLNKDKYKDNIYTGDGNDVVVGGIGGDRIETGATDRAEAKLDGVSVWSVNFTREDDDDSLTVRQATYEKWEREDGELGKDYEIDGNGNKYALDANKKRIVKIAGESAGVVVDNDWHNLYVKNNELHDKADYSSHTIDGVDVYISSYAENSGWWNENHAGNTDIINENSQELDGDTSNSKLYNGYMASQQQYEIKVTLNHIDQFRSKNGLDAGEACDLYVYLGGDNNDTDTYNYIYSISLNNVDYRYLNDWTGYNFDGDYKEATFSNYIEAWNSANQVLNDSTVRVRLEGNYVVFHNFTGDKAEIRIKNVYTFGGQSPKNLPLVSAVQIVAGEGKEGAAIGGDHDKDLVYGDEAKLWFDLDIPYAADENIADYKNRVIEAKSVAVDNDVAEAVSTEDTIKTGKDRDVAIGGEGSDNFTMGDGDDIALGGNANLIVEHNNPVGVFTPNTEIVLDQHTINTNTHQNFLDNDNSQVQQFQDLLNQHRIQGIDTNLSNENDRYDTFDMGTGRNLTYQDSWSNEQLVVPQQQPEEHQNNSGNDQGNDETQNNSGNDQGNDETQNNSENNQGNSNEGQNGSQESLRQYVLDKRDNFAYITINAGETVELVLTDWNEGNQDYHPNILLRLNALDDCTHTLEFSWNELVENNGQVSIEKSGTVTVSLLHYNVVDIPDSANVVGEHKIILRVHSDEDILFMASVGNQ